MAFLAINNAFSSSTTDQEGNKFRDSSDEYDEEEEEDDSVTDNPGIAINGGMNHHFPVTTISSPIQPVSSQHRNIPQPNVKIHGTGESGLILNQSNRPQPIPTHSAHLYGHDYHHTPAIVKDTSAHSKHQLNTQLILSQQRDNENKQHHGFKPMANPDNKSQFLFSSTTRQPPVLFTTKSPSGYSAAVNAPTIEPFSLHPIGPQPPLQTTQQSPGNSPFSPQTNAHQVPPSTLPQQIHADIANSGGFLRQTIQISQNPLTFQFSSNGNNRQGHQLFTTPSVAVISTTSSTSSSSSVRSGPSGKAGNIAPVISLTSSIGSTPKGSSAVNTSSLSVQLFSETTPPNSYDEYQEEDVPSDPFFRDVPKIPKPSTTIKNPSARHGVRNKREAHKKHPAKTKIVFVPPHNNIRYKRRAAAQVGLPTEVFGTGEGRYRNSPEGSTRSHGVELGRQSNSRGRTRVEIKSRRISTPEELGPKETGGRSRPSPFVPVAHEASTVASEVLQEPSQYSSIGSDFPMSNFARKNSESTISDSSVTTGNRQGHRRTVVKVRRPYNVNIASDTVNHHPSEIPRLFNHTESSQQFVGNQRLHVKSAETSSPPTLLTASTSGSIETYDIPKTSVRIKAENSQMSQDFIENVPNARTHGRGERRRLQHQPYESNLDKDRSTENSSGRSRQRSRQRTRLQATDSTHKTYEHLPRGSSSSLLRNDTIAMKSASRRADHRPNSEDTEDGILYSSRAVALSNIRSNGGKLDVSSTYEGMTRLRFDRNKEKLSTNESDVESGATTESIAESSSPAPSLPETSFTCADKIPGGYYADLEADCQLFHICSMGRHGK